MTKLLFREVVLSHGYVVNADWLRAYCDGLERKPVHDGFGWGWAVLLAPSAEVRDEIRRRAHKSFQEKPLACILCGEQPATQHQILAGKVCLECFTRMEVSDVERNVMVR
ncbi:MAG: hypothetical protein L0287_10075 [Anaerolineae bacterium]|nr:hypothetical protein [Anaerolineae bacterium]